MGLRLRFVIPLACLLVAYVGVHAYLTAKSQGAEILSEATLSTLRLANTVRRSTRHAMLHSRREDVHKMIEEIGEQEGIDHIRILNKGGVITYSAEKSEINQVVDRKAEACYQCHDAEKPLTKLETSQRARVFRTGDGHRTLAAIDVIYNEPACWNADCHAHTESQSLLGVVDIGVSLAEADHRVAETTRNAILFGLASSIAICGLVGLLIHRLVNRPVQRLLDGTRRIANGDLDCLIPVTSSDELGHLAQSFNKMTEDLGKAHEELSNWAEKLAEEVENKTRELKLAQAQVVRSEKLSSLGLLAAGVAHELNSPLTGILTFAHILGKKLPENAPEREHLEVILSQTNRCATIIRQLLDFSRETSTEKKPRDLHAVLQQAIALVEHQALFHNIRIERDLAADLPEISMDAGRMQQVFLNLLVNAGEAMPEGGSLTISTRVMTNSTLPEAAAAAPKKLKIVFRDTGVGIPPDTIDKIFDPFFTSKDVGQGTGLGLAVSYGIIERHGGMIEVESTPGKGTTFTITLPVDGGGAGLDETR
jgi:two-component system NtrC family sensor kinase